METDLLVLLRLGLITILAGLVGWEREEAGKAAGLRTHILVGISSLLFVILGEQFIIRFQTFDASMRFDPVRVIEAVVTGISFLGAGTIFVTRGKDTVKGLTTAAGILTTAAVGMAVAIDRYIIAIGTTAIVFIILRFLNRFEAKYLSTADRSDPE